MRITTAEVACKEKQNVLLKEYSETSIKRTPSGLFQVSA